MEDNVLGVLFYRSHFQTIKQKFYLLLENLNQLRYLNIGFVLSVKLDKLGVDKLVPVPVDLRKLSDVVKNDVVKKVRIKNSEDKIPFITNLATNTTLNAEINEVKGEVPNITNLATTTTAPTAVENTIPNVSNLVKKTDYNTKVSEIENKITTGHDHDK